MSQTLEKIRKQFPIALEAIEKMHLKESYLEFVLQIFDEMMATYQLTAVDQNQLCHSLDVEQLQQAQIKRYQGVLGFLNKVMAACGAETQNEINSIMTRLGEDDPEEFTQVLAIMQQDRLPGPQLGDTKSMLMQREMKALPPVPASKAPKILERKTKDSLDDLNLTKMKSKDNITTLSEVNHAILFKPNLKRSQSESELLTLKSHKKTLPFS